MNSRWRALSTYFGLEEPEEGALSGLSPATAFCFEAVELYWREDCPSAEGARKSSTKGDDRSEETSGARGSAKKDFIVSE